MTTLSASTRGAGRAPVRGTDGGHDRLVRVVRYRPPHARPAVAAVLGGRPVVRHRNHPGLVRPVRAGVHGPGPVRRATERRRDAGAAGRDDPAGVDQHLPRARVDRESGRRRRARADGRLVRAVVLGVPRVRLRDDPARRRARRPAGVRLRLPARRPVGAAVDRHRRPSRRQRRVRVRADPAPPRHRPDAVRVRRHPPSGSPALSALCE